MKNSRGNLIFIIVLIISTIAVGWRNYLLREQLRAANLTITDLQAGIFREGTSAPTVQEPIQLVVLKTKVSNNSPVNVFSSKLKPGDECDRCGSKREDQTSSKDLFKSVPQMSLLGLKRRYFPGPDSRFTLFIFFSPTDCPACLREAKIWEKLFRDGDAFGLSVVGIIDHCSRQEAEAVQMQLGTTFPVLFDAQSMMRGFFGISQTPEKILVNAQDKVILTSGGNRTQEGQLAFDEAIRTKFRQ